MNFLVSAASGAALNLVRLHDLADACKTSALYLGGKMSAAFPNFTHSVESQPSSETGLSRPVAAACRFVFKMRFCMPYDATKSERLRLSICAKFTGDHKKCLIMKG